MRCHAMWCVTYGNILRMNLTNRNPLCEDDACFSNHFNRMLFESMSNLGEMFKIEFSFEIFSNDTKWLMAAGFLLQITGRITVFGLKWFHFCNCFLLLRPFDICSDCVSAKRLGPIEMLISWRCLDLRCFVFWRLGYVCIWQRLILVINFLIGIKTTGNSMERPHNGTFNERSGNDQR